jgi:tetratricopeptide (TPR) repeat protein
MNCLYPYSSYLIKKAKIHRTILLILLYSTFHPAVVGLSFNNLKFIDDTAAILKQLRSFKILVFKDPDSVLNSISFIEKNTQDELILAHCNRYRGVIALTNGLNEEALNYNFKAQETLKKFGDEYNLNILNLNIGVAYLRMGYYSLANDYLYKARAYFDNSNDLITRSRVYVNLTFLFELLKQNEKAEQIVYQSLEAAKIAHDTIALSSAFYNLAEIVYLRQKDYPEAIKAYKKAAEIAESAGIQRSLAYAQRGLGQAYFLAGKIDSAKYYLNLALNSLGSDLLTKIQAHQNYADVYISESAYKMALEHSRMALSLSKQIEMKPHIIQTYKQLSIIYSKLKNYEKAYDYRDSSAVLSDSLYEEKRMKQAMELEEIYQNKKKQEEIDTLAYENQKTENLVITLVLVLVVLLLVAFFVYRVNKLKVANKQSELEQKLLRSQMNPHFIFNAISSIQNFVQKNKPTEASLYLANFAKLMRHILLNSREEFIALEDEINTLENYLKLQQLRYNNQFNFEINVSEDIDSEEIGLPPMLLQPFVENSIKHGIAKKAEGYGSIAINFHSNSGSLIAELTDNGIGRQKADERSEKKHISLATKITRERLNHLGRAFRKKASIEIVDLIDDKEGAKGTKVIIKLPLRYI